MGFWVRKTIFGIVLIIIAYLLLANQELLVSLAMGDGSDTEESEMNSPVAEKVIDDVPQKAPPKKKVNSAAEGLSRFYASINPSFEEGQGPRIRDNVVYLDKPAGDLEKILEAKKNVTRPLRKSWRGDKASRAFRTGQTLYQKLSEYGEEQGIEVLWRLDKDFIVKDPFRINNNLVKTAFQVGKAVEGHFENGINIYFCHQHKALVLTDQELGYLDTECQLQSSNQSSW